MKYFDWNEKKNELLKKERNISFEEIIFAIADDRLLDVLEHPNKEKYPKQKLLIVEINQYAYIVPVVENKETYFMKTIYPSRKATHNYLKQKE